VKLPKKAAPEHFDVDALIDDPATRIIVCCGSGGVGKTTTAAALGLRAAERGRRVCVLTIDPARRLAQSLGLDELDNTPRQIEHSDAGPGGAMFAMMLDMKRTFDEIVEQHADPERAQQILVNPFYQSLSSSFAGTQEYMAMEKLGQLHREADAEGRWDLVVVDTPPSRSALDFLDAPQRLGSFLDGRLIRILTAPARAGGRAYMKVIGIGFSLVTGALTKILGGQLLGDLQTLVASLDSVFGGFRERAEQTYSLLQADGTAFVVVAAPEPDALREASYFVERLQQDLMPLAGLVVNRVHTTEAPDLTSERAAGAAEDLEEHGEHALTAALLRLHADTMRVRSREHRLMSGFTGAHPHVRVAVSPALPGDVHDLPGLRLVGAALAAGATSWPDGRLAAG
jgi:anion-transporting  ArsA/GET3 family ATPase